MSLSKLLAGLGNIIEKAAGARVEETFSGRIPDNRVFRTDPQSGQTMPYMPGTPFERDRNYLQVTINHMYVTDSRKLWVEREHFGAIWMSLLYDGTRQSIPFILGRGLLADRVAGIPEGGRIDFSNVRISRVYPYVGDSLALYLGLWSAPTTDWASKAFGALDVIAGKVKVAASLSLVLDMIEVLNQGIGSILGINEVQARLNLYQEFQQPDLGSDVGVLQPGYYVMVNAPRAAFDASMLAVKDDRLYIWRAQDRPLEEFFDHDFLLYNIGSLNGYPAATSLFDKQFTGIWQALIASKMDPDKLKEARQLFYTLLAQIVGNPDLAREEKSHLLAWYRERLNKEAALLAINPEGGPPIFTAGAETTELQPPSQEEYEAFRANVGPASREGSLAALAGDAAIEFSTTLDGVVRGKLDVRGTTGE